MVNNVSEIILMAAKTIPVIFQKNPLAQIIAHLQMHFFLELHMSKSFDRCEKMTLVVGLNVITGPNRKK